MKTLLPLLSLMGVAMLGLAPRASADTIHVVAREYVLKGQGTKEPVWEAHRKAQEWHKPSEGVVEKYNEPAFPEITGSFDFGDKLTFTAGKSGRGRIVIALHQGETLLAQSQDNTYGDSGALVYTHTSAAAIYKLEIKVWTTP